MNEIACICIAVSWVSQRVSDRFARSIQNRIVHIVHGVGRRENRTLIPIYKLIKSQKVDKTLRNSRKEKSGKSRLIWYTSTLKSEEAQKETQIHRKNTNIHIYTHRLNRKTHSNGYKRHLISILKHCDSSATSQQQNQQRFGKIYSKIVCVHVIVIIIAVFFFSKIKKLQIVQCYGISKILTESSEINNK